MAFGAGTALDAAVSQWPRLSTRRREFPKPTPSAGGGNHSTPPPPNGGEPQPSSAARGTASPVWADGWVRAAASNAWRRLPCSFSAWASSCTDVSRGRLTRPASSSRMVRVLSPARFASFSCDSNARSRCARSNSPKLAAGAGTARFGSRAAIGACAAPRRSMPGLPSLYRRLLVTRASARPACQLPGARRQGGEVVDAGAVAPGAVGGEGGVVLARCPLVEQVALLGVVVARDRGAARIGDAPDIDHHHGTGTAVSREPRRQLVPSFRTGQHDPSLPIQAHDPRRTGEGAEHEGDAAVVAQVGDGLGAAAGQVQVGDGPLVQDRQGVGVALGREVDVATAAAG